MKRNHKLPRIEYVMNKNTKRVVLAQKTRPPFLVTLSLINYELAQQKLHHLITV